MEKEVQVENMEMPGEEHVCTWRQKISSNLCVFSGHGGPTALAIKGLFSVLCVCVCVFIKHGIASTRCFHLIFHVCTKQLVGQTPQTCAIVRAEY